MLEAACRVVLLEVSEINADAVGSDDDAATTTSWITSSTGGSRTPLFAPASSRPYAGGCDEYVVLSSVKLVRPYVRAAAWAMLLIDVALYAVIALVMGRLYLRATSDLSVVFTVVAGPLQLLLMLISLASPPRFAPVMLATVGYGRLPTPTLSVRAAALMEMRQSRAILPTLLRLCCGSRIFHRYIAAYAALNTVPWLRACFEAGDPAANEHSRHPGYRPPLSILPRGSRRLFVGQITPVTARSRASTAGDSVVGSFHWSVESSDDRDGRAFDGFPDDCDDVGDEESPHGQDEHADFEPEPAMACPGTLVLFTNTPLGAPSWPRRAQALRLLQVQLHHTGTST